MKSAVEMIDKLWGYSRAAMTPRLGFADPYQWPAAPANRLSQKARRKRAKWGRGRK